LSPVIAKEAGTLKSQHRGTPIGDCIVAATAIMNRPRALKRSLITNSDRTLSSVVWENDIELIDQNPYS
jgi:hypothetical protein